MKYLLLLFPLLLIQCNDSENDMVSNSGNSGPGNSGSGGNTDWLIPVALVFDGGPGKDGIPALTDPEMTQIGSEALAYINDNDLVLVTKAGNSVMAYSHKVLDWHEIINTNMGDEQVAVTYCPLTGTGIGWGRTINGKVSTFGVSGKIFETNLMPYDRLTDSYWSQMFNQCVNGKLAGTVPEFFALTEMKFAALKEMYPNAMVVTRNTGYSREYSLYPYGSYNEVNNKNILFPISNWDDRLPPKEIVKISMIDNVAYSFRSSSTQRSVNHIVVENSHVVVYSDSERGIILTFITDDLTEQSLVFSIADLSASPALFQDNLGNQWDAFGEALSGPNAGERMTIPYSYNGFWFAVANFFPEIPIIE